MDTMLNILWELKKQIEDLEAKITALHESVKTRIETVDKDK
jgi:hypothetical protein